MSSREIHGEAGPARPEIVVHRDPLDRTTVVQASGDLKLTATKFLESAIADVVRRPNERLLIDLSECRSLDGDALITLLCARRALDSDRDEGPPISVVASSAAAEALEEAGIAQVVPTVSDRHAALDILLG
jgi:anti-anti-sigma regulatory factor